MGYDEGIYCVALIKNKVIMSKEVKQMQRAFWFK